jgi:hypothetical protein
MTMTRTQQLYEVTYLVFGEVEGWTGETVLASSPEEAYRLVCPRLPWNDWARRQVRLVAQDVHSGG